MKKARKSLVFFLLLFVFTTMMACGSPYCFSSRQQKAVEVACREVRWPSAAEVTNIPSDPTTDRGYVECVSFLQEELKNLKIPEDYWFSPSCEGDYCMSQGYGVALNWAGSPENKWDLNCMLGGLKLAREEFFPEVK